MYGGIRLMYKFLLVEDSLSDVEAFQTTIKRMNRGNGQTIYELVIAESVDKAMEMIDSTYNGAIIDINLGEHSGNEVIHMITEKLRVSIAIFTGTPDTSADSLGIPIYKKGEANQEEIVTELCEISDTGLFSVISGVGIIEEAMTKIFWNNLYPQINIWKLKKSQGVDTEKVLLRYVVSHIQELIDTEVPAYETEEMYIKPPVTNEIRTGGIYTSKRDSMSCIVLSPPCDLAIRADGKPKTDRILVCEIDDNDSVVSIITSGIEKKDKKIKAIEKALKNNYSDYYHWLPRNDIYQGGYINFRKVITYSPEDFAKEFEKSEVKVQEFFVKSILNRFSAYYARQGQPDFKFKDESKHIFENAVCLEGKSSN